MRKLTVKKTSTFLLPPHCARSLQIAEAAYPQIYAPHKARRKKEMSRNEAATLIQANLRGRDARMALLQGM